MAISWYEAKCTSRKLNIDVASFSKRKENKSISVCMLANDNGRCLSS